MKQNKSKVLVASTIISTFIYLLWRTLFTLPRGYGKLAAAFGIILLLAEIFGMVEQIIHFMSMTVIERPKRPEIAGLEYPTVDVFIATYNEPIGLLYKTINACVNMGYPNKDKVAIYLCDDGNREEARKLADHMGIQYLARKEHKGAKAGNLNYGLANSKGELIVTFDADMIPMSDFLMECVPYFMSDLKNARELECLGGKEMRRNRKGKIGFVQTPQSFYNLDLFQFNLYSEENIPNEQDYFYLDIQMAKNRTNSVIYGGSNTVISREALDEIGGFVTNVITEDFATGMLIQSKGYTCIAIDEVHASGLSPEDMESLIKQRRRWARGCIQTGRKWNILTRKGLNMKQKISYMVSIAYWYDSLKRLIYMVAPIMYSVFGITVFVASPLELLIFWLPMYWLNSVMIRYLSGNIRTLQWTNIYETIMFPLLLKDVIFEMASLSQTQFSVTRKGAAKHNLAYQMKMAIPHCILTLLTLYGTLRCLFIIFATGNVSISFLFFWLVMNLYNLTMALFFMLGRRSLRKSERFVIEADCEITMEHEVVKTKTFDISEGGFSILMDYPQYIEPDHELKIVLRERNYQAKACAKIIQVMRYQEKWKYAFQITNIKEREYRNLLYILHDRVPPLTKQVQSKVGFFDNIKTNLTKRTMVKYHGFNRKLPRVMLRKPLVDHRGEKVVLLSFDYWYVSLEEKKGSEQNKKRMLKLKQDLPLLLEYERSLDYGDSEGNQKTEVGLYKIINRVEVLEHPGTIPMLLEWDRNHTAQMKQQKIRQIENEETVFDEMALL